MTGATTSFSAGFGLCVSVDFEDGSGRARRPEVTGAGRDAGVVVASVCIRARFGVENWSSPPLSRTTTLTATACRGATAGTPEPAGEGAGTGGNATGELELA